MKKVAVITRTKDRPILLGRAVTSVSRQTLRDFEWVVVNDGGLPGPVDAAADSARSSGIEVSVHHLTSSRGMEAASNHGLRSSESEYVVIHDDDDSWAPAFLEETVGYLAAREGSPVAGVVTRCLRVEEEIDGEKVVERRRTLFDPGLVSVTLFQMATLVSVPPPISFLYRRSILEEVGLYREDLPVLGDWEFNLRFLRRYDVGVIPKPLANYHWRVRPTQLEYGNTVVTGLPLHAEYAARLRNELLRKDLDSGVFGVGVLVNLAQYLGETSKRLSPLSSAFAMIQRSSLLRRVYDRATSLR